MDTQKVTSKYRLSQWMQVIRERQSSGRTIKDFCKEKGISRNKYFYWQRKIRNAACEELAKSGNPTDLIPNGWIQLTQEQQVKETLDIEVGGCRITVDTETNPELLKKVCSILRVL
jgi:putative transposase